MVSPLEANAPTAPATAPIDTFVCVHERDLGPLFELVLRAYQRHFLPKGALILIANNLPKLRDFVERAGLADGIVLSTDEEWLSRGELALPGWYRQQVIKLRAHRFCATERFCNLGSDTLLLDDIATGDFVADGRPVLYYSRATTVGRALLGLEPLRRRYERRRVEHVARILGVQPRRARRYADFINDLFCFEREYLEGLNAHLERRYGPDCYTQLLGALGDGRPDTNPFGNWTQNRFGEWTLYSVYVLDQLKAEVILRNASAGYLLQIHSARQLRLSRFDSRVVHLVAKGFDLAAIEAKIAAREPALGRHTLPIGSAPHGDGRPSSPARSAR